MKKIYIILIVGLCLIGIVGAGAIIFNFSPVTIDYDISKTFPKLSGSFTFRCDGKLMTSDIISEPNIDDFEEEEFLPILRIKCKGKITEIKDWTGRQYEENEYGLKSFNQDKLKEDVCGKEGQLFNSTSKECYEYKESIEPNE